MQRNHLQRQEPPADYIIQLLDDIRNMNIAGVKLLLKEAKDNNYDINFNDPKTKYTPLHFAITKTTIANEQIALEIIEELKKAGADVNKAAQDLLHNTPIHTACRRALPSTVFWLIENGVDVNIQDTSDQTPLDYVNKQISNQKDDMIKERLLDIRILLSLALSNESYKTAETLANFGLFSSVLIGGAMIMAGVYNLRRTP